MKAHEILNITLAQLENITDNLLQNAYRNKLQDLDDINVIEETEYFRRKQELDDAFSVLATQQKRSAYLQEMNQSQLIVSSLETDTTKQSTLSNATWEDINKKVHIYQQYIDKKIQNLHPSHADYKKTKEKLENDKKKANLVEEKFENYDEFVNSTAYQNFSLEDKNRYSKNHFPKKIIAVTYSFSDVDEAINYFKINEGIESARRLMNQFETKGIKASPEVIASLNPISEQPIIPLNSCRI